MEADRLTIVVEADTLQAVEALTILENGYTQHVQTLQGVFVPAVNQNAIQLQSAYQQLALKAQELCFVPLQVQLHQLPETAAQTAKNMQGSFFSPMQAGFSKTTSAAGTLLERLKALYNWIEHHPMDSALANLAESGSPQSGPTSGAGTTSSYSQTTTSSSVVIHHIYPAEKVQTEANPTDLTRALESLPERIADAVLLKAVSR